MIAVTVERERHPRVRGLSGIDFLHRELRQLPGRRQSRRFLKIDHGLHGFRSEAPIVRGDNETKIEKPLLDALHEVRRRLNRRIGSGLLRAPSFVGLLRARPAILAPFDRRVGPCVKGLLAGRTVRTQKGAELHHGNLAVAERLLIEIAAQDDDVVGGRFEADVSFELGGDLEQSLALVGIGGAGFDGAPKDGDNETHRLGVFAKERPLLTLKGRMEPQLGRGLRLRSGCSEESDPHTDGG